VVVSRGDGTAAVLALPPLASAASCLVALRVASVTPLFVNGDPAAVRHASRLRMGDVVSLTAPTSPPRSPALERAPGLGLVAPLGSSPPERLLVDLPPEAWERTRERMHDMMGAVL
jgi:hypothetical protein